MMSWIEYYNQLHRVTARMATTGNNLSAEDFNEIATELQRIATDLRKEAERRSK